ncbi:MAG: nucleotidyltransferase domain-containing protein [Desulfurococcales archaeon]|nr:nucleotidyltransferase domain-containing protein [Desulfurococcales archaeon]
MLFGSRARGDHKEESDYDILIVVKNKLDWRMRKLLWRNIYIRLCPLLRAPIDLIIEDTSYYSQMIRDDLSFEAIITGEGIHA